MKNKQKYNIFIDVTQLKCPRPVYVINKVLHVNKKQNLTLLFKTPGVLYDLDIRLLFLQMAYNIISKYKKTIYTSYIIKKKHTERET